MVRPEMTKEMKLELLTKNQEQSLEVAEMRMLRFSFGVARRDKIRNELVKKHTNVRGLLGKLREA